MFGLKVLSNKEFQGLRETITLYQRTLEDIGWINLSLEQTPDRYLFAEGFQKMLKRVKLYYYNNPLAGHWVHLTTIFVFGEGISIPKANDENIQKVINQFWDDPDNKLALTTFQKQQLLCNKLQYEGNLFFVLFDDEEGNIKVRVLNTEEVVDIIKDANDRMRTNFYKVGTRERKYNFSSDSYDTSFSKYIYYPDWNNFEIKEFKIPAGKLKEDCVIYHIKINCDINDKYGIPELYRGIDWIKAHKDMAGDLATLIKSLSTIAWKKKVKGTPGQVAALKKLWHAKDDLTNIAPGAGSTQIENQGIELEPINTPTGGAIIGKEGLKQMQLMVCAASGLFYHYYGDPSTGNLATATSMELPMIKKFANYQKLWSDIINNILQYVINKKIEVGLLDGSIKYDEKNKRKVYTTKLDRFIDIDFPPIIEKDLKLVAEALQVAIMNNLISDETAAQIFLLAANVNNIDEEIEKIFPKDKTKSQPSKEADIKEKIETPEKKPALRFVKKNNFVLQRMNGYRKALAGHFRDFQIRVRNSVKAKGDEGKVVGIVEGLDEALSKLEKGMKNVAKIYYPIAIDIGKKFLQAHLKESQIKETIFEARGKEKDLLAKKLEWNDKYVTGSLIPDIKKEITGKVRQAYDSPDDFMEAINEGMNKFEGRIEQYAGAFWSVEEAAVKEAGKETGLMVNFVGADDGATCDDCQRFMEGNPYPIDEAPEPGTDPICNGRCRHALQVIER